MRCAGVILAHARDLLMPHERSPRAPWKFVPDQIVTDSMYVCHMQFLYLDLLVYVASWHVIICSAFQTSDIAAYVPRSCAIGRRSLSVVRPHTMPEFGLCTDYDCYPHSSL